MKRSTRITSTLVLGQIIDQFLGQALQMSVYKKEGNVIDFVEGNDEAKRLFRSVKKVASDVLMTMDGQFKTKSMDSLYNKFKYKVVCVEKDANEVWLTAGIETRLGIIIFD